MDTKTLLAMPKSDYMNGTQIAFFKGELLKMQQERLEQIEAARKQITEMGASPDPFDAATVEESRLMLTRTIDRANTSLREIKQALEAIREGEYGWCLMTGVEIGLARLIAKPTALLSVDAQSSSEKISRHYAAA